MDVHIGKLHSEKIECGICECVTKTLEDKEVHLSGCEVYNRVCHKNNFFEYLAPILVCHGNRYQKAPKKVSGPNMNISESASHFCKYKGNGKIYKGKLYPIFF